MQALIVSFLNYLHSNMIIFKLFEDRSPLKSPNLIYIPIWLYLSKIERWATVTYRILIYIPIWLYLSGGLFIKDSELKKYLHSNMVIFKP